MKTGLALELMGGVTLTVNGAPLPSFKSEKGKALLCYLAVTGRSQPRPMLAGLLWPYSPEASALANLRKVLNRLPDSLTDYIVATRQTIGLRPERHIWLDLTQLEACRAPNAAIDALREAVARIKGDFLDGFFLRDAPAFNEWAAAQRARLHHLMLGALQRLLAHDAGQGDFKQAIAYARQLLALEPWQEETHRELMRLLAVTGQRAAALAQYEQCRQVLADELSVAPTSETAALYRAIRDGEVESGDRDGSLSVRPVPYVVEPTKIDQLVEDAIRPAFVSTLPGTLAVQRPPLVNREKELLRLAEALATANAGHGGILFVTGEAGAGKTALVDEFAHRALRDNPQLVYAAGACDVYVGADIPFSPFREIVQMLTGNLESHWQTGTLTSVTARRLWERLPEATQVLLEHGHELVGPLIPLADITGRLAAYVAENPEQRAVLTALLALPVDPRNEVSGDQQRVRDAVTAVLTAMATQKPLLLFLDDLHWSDLSSIMLLGHLGRRLANQRILLVASFRPEEVGPGREGKAHPLSRVHAEFRRRYGEIEIRLNRASYASQRAFVDAVLDLEPNRLGPDFRRRLAQRTGGNALFTVEAIGDMRASGALYRDETGQWQASERLSWKGLAARVEGAIERRIRRLPAELIELLTIASVEGETFTVEVVATAMNLDERDAVRLLSRDLDKKHRLIKAQGMQHVGGRRIARYRFHHQLFQEYLYGQLDEVDRAMLHEAVAQALEMIYREQKSEIAAQLARHYENAGLLEKACGYLMQAGDTARTLYALDDAIQHYEKALTFLKQAGDYERAVRALIKLGLAYHSAFDYARSRRAYEESFALRRLVTPDTAERPLPRAPHALRFMVGAFLTLDPAKHTSFGTSAVQKQLLSGLVSLTPDFDVVPNVAERWEILKGGRSYVIHLRSDVQWSDGQPVTAADFICAWRRALDPDIASPSVPLLLFDIAGAAAWHRGDRETLGIHAVDDLTLRIDLEEPTAYFLQMLTSNTMLPVPHHLVEEFGEAWAEPGTFVGNGPFKLVSWERGGFVTLERNPCYHGRFSGNVERLEIDSSSDPHRCYALYEANALDIVNIHYLPPNEGYEAARRHASEYMTWPNYVIIFLRFDTRRPPLDDRRVRRALALSVNRERLANVDYLGLATAATGGLVPPGIPGHVPEIAPAYDLAAARQLLAEAGFPNGESLPPIMTLVDNYWSTFLDPVLDGWVSNLGIRLERKNVDHYWNWSGDVLPQVIGGACVPDYPDPVEYLRHAMRSAMVPELAPMWRDPRYDDLLERAGHQQDQQTRMALYREAEMLLVREAPIIPLTYGRSHVLVRPWVRNYWRQDGFKDVIIEPH